MKEKPFRPSEYYSQYPEEIAQHQREIEASKRKRLELGPKVEELRQKYGNLTVRESRALEKALAEMIRLNKHIEETQKIINGLRTVERKGKKFLKKFDGTKQ